MSLHREKLERTFPPETSRYFEVPSGESSKSIAMWQQMVDFAFKGSLRRNTPFVAVGGGVTGDLSGFAAASLLRGLPLIHVPTTLLAMVDSAIGGKTGVNHPFGKNTIGAFYHPRAVLFDPSFLTTLPEREWLCGISEVLKYGYIRDPELLDMGTRLADPASRTDDVLKDVIERSVRIKSDIVAGDARESGDRAFLNFGHTFAHALEALDGYSNINHGEAVYAGMIAALFVSRKNGAPVSDEALVSLQNVYNLDLEHFRDSTDQLVSLMANDKKNRDHTVRLVLLRDYGRPVVQSINDKRILKEAWNYMFDVLGR
jgi:3-dehydroquinate synthase